MSYPQSFTQSVTSLLLISSDSLCQGLTQQTKGKLNSWAPTQVTQKQALKVSVIRRCMSTYQVNGSYLSNYMEKSIWIYTKHFIKQQSNFSFTLLEFQKGFEQVHYVMFITHKCLNNVYSILPFCSTSKVFSWRLLNVNNNTQGHCPPPPFFFSIESTITPGATQQQLKLCLLRQT